MSHSLPRVHVSVFVSGRICLAKHVSFIKKPTAAKDSKSLPIYNDAIYHVDEFQIYEGMIFIRGWIFDKQTGHTFEKVIMGLQGDTTIYKAKLELQMRPDVATAFGNSVLKKSGFIAKMIDIRGLKSGVYRYVLIVQKEGKQYIAR